MHAPRVTRDNLKQLAERSFANKTLVMPACQNFVKEQLGDECGGLEDELVFAERYGYVCPVEVHWSTLASHAGSLCKELQWKHEEHDDGARIKRARSLKTPCGVLSETTTFHKKNQLTFHDEPMVRNERDLEAVAWLIRESVRAVMDRREEVKAEILNKVAPAVRMAKDRGVSLIHLWTPALEVLYPFFSQEAMIYAMVDHGTLMRELMDEAMQYTRLLIDIGVEADVDSMQTAVWGYEQWSPGIYEEFVMPYLVPMAEQTRQGGALFWIHTCGKMRGLIEQRMYHRMEPDLLECLNYPPAGDIERDDWPRLRATLPEGTVTKGNIEDSLLLCGPTDEIKRTTLEILRQSEGFRHIFSTSNGFYNGTPREHFETMIDTIHEYETAGR